MGGWEGTLDRRAMGTGAVAPPGLSDEQKRRNPGQDDQLDARSSSQGGPIRPRHFKDGGLAHGLA